MPCGVNTRVIFRGMQPDFSATQTGWRREWDSKPELAIFPKLILKQMRAVRTGFSVFPSLMAIRKW
jgi:hypothetical protein